MSRLRADAVVGQGAGVTATAVRTGGRGGPRVSAAGRGSPGNRGDDPPRGVAFARCVPRAAGSGATLRGSVSPLLLDGRITRGSAPRSVSPACVGGLRACG